MCRATFDSVTEFLDTDLCNFFLDFMVFLLKKVQLDAWNQNLQNQLTGIETVKESRIVQNDLKYISLLKSVRHHDFFSGPDFAFVNAIHTHATLTR